MPSCAIRLFGMSLLERSLQGIRAASVDPEDVCVALPPDGAAPQLPRDLTDALPVRFEAGTGGATERLAAALAAAQGKPLLALAADTVVDTRVVAHLCGTPGSIAFVDGADDRRGAALRIEGEPAEVGIPGDDLLAIAERAVRNGSAKEFAETDFPGYIPMLRRHLAPYLFRVRDGASRDRVERFLFWSNYKGSTDFLTKYVYPPLVWACVKPLARWRVHPNWVTAVDWLATFATVPLFAAGAWLPGLLLAYGMSVLDSVDGKLARLTYTSSKFGEIFDHGLDIVHPPIWYMAWAWALGGGDPASLPFRASLWLFGFYVLDRACAGIFKARTGMSIHGATPLDEKVRTFISRRNVNLVLFTAALLVDWAVPGWHAAVATFYFIVAWQAACLLWHAERLVQFWNTRAPA